MKIFITIIIALIAATPGILAYNIAKQNSKLNHPLKLHEQTATSYKDEINSIEKRGDIEKANSLRKEYENFEKEWRDAWKADQFIENVADQLLFKHPDDIPAKSLAEIDKAIKALENSPISTGTNTTSLGTAYYVLGDYEKALESFKISLKSQPDNTDLRVLQAGTLISIAISPKYKNNMVMQIALKNEANQLVSTDYIKLSIQQKRFLDKIKRQKTLAVIDQ